MARIVLGIGTAHSPLVSEPPQFWGEHGEWDKAHGEVIASAYGGGDVAVVTRQRESRLAQEVGPSRYEERYRTIAAALDATRATLLAAKPDVLVVVGDDQEDLFTKDSTPAMGVYRGEAILNPAADLSKYPGWRGAAAWGYRGESEERYPCEPNLATHLVKSLTAAHFDIAHVTVPSEGRHVGHAFTFVARRLLRDVTIPMVPFMLNTYFPPNQPTVARCYALGGALRRAVESWDSPKTIALIASGGLTHPIVDEELDRRVLKAMVEQDSEALIGLDEDVFRLGTSEIKNWIVVCGAMSGTGLRMKVLDYVPGYRSTAGTGCGMAFAQWTN